MTRRGAAAASRRCRAQERRAARSPLVLVAESTFIMALALTGTRRGLDHRLLDPAGSVAEAVDLKHRPRRDLARLDADLADGATARLAAVLDGMQVPFALITAYDRGSLADLLLRRAA